MPSPSRLSVEYGVSPTIVLRRRRNVDRTAQRFVVEIVKDGTTLALTPSP
jgi:hypothetical protein